MRSLLQVEDLALSEALEGKYNLALFATGYESRCVALSEMLEPRLVDRALVWGFEREALPALRRSHDLHFLQKWGMRPEIVRHSDFSVALASMGTANAKGNKRRWRVLVDYSSMSRMWYAAALSYFRFFGDYDEVTLDFSYTPGKYSSGYSEEMRNSVVSRIASVPGMEGLSGTRESSIAVLGLGFAPAAAMSVLERLQPQLIFSYYASPALHKDYEDACADVNRSLISSSKFVLRLPLASVSSSYKRLSEALTPFLASQQVTIIPMGPKPHVLTSMLVATRFRQVGCMYAELGRRDVSDVEPDGNPRLVRVTMR